MDSNKLFKRTGSGLWTDKDGTMFIGKDYAKQNEIEEAIAKRNARSCFRACGTCGACANSHRDGTYPYSYDHNARKNINCRSCEPHRFHDCNNGWFRDSYQKAEPFTDTQLDLLKLAEDGRPLM